MGARTPAQTPAQGAEKPCLQELGKSEQSELIRSAIPEVFEAKARALGGLRAPVMLFRDVVRLTNLTTKQMKPIIENKALHFSMTGDGPRPKV